MGSDTTTEIIRKDIDTLKRQSGELDRRCLALERTVQTIGRDVDTMAGDQKKMMHDMNKSLVALSDKVGAVSVGFGRVEEAMKAEARASERDRNGISELFQRLNRKDQEERDDLRERVKTHWGAWLAIILAVVTGIIGWAFALAGGG